MQCSARGFFAVRFGSTFALGMLAAAAAWAAPTFTVNSTADAPGASTAGASLTDGVCETQHGNGTCTLRAAIMEANHVPGGGATIALPPGVYRIEIAGLGGDDEAAGSLDLLAPMRIVGEGPSASIVDGNHVANLDVRGIGVVLEGLTVRRGFEGPMIYNHGDLTLENVAVSEAPADITALQNDTTGTVSLTHCVVAHNTGPSALFNYGTARVADSLIADNVVTYTGGGVHNEGELTIERTSILRNATDAAGGGVFSIAGDLVLINDTVAENQSGLGAQPSGGGGGLRANGGTLRLFNTTVRGNASIRYGEPSGGGIETTGGGSVFLRNSIVAGNFVGYLDGPFIYGPSDCMAAQPLLSGDYDLIGRPADCPLTGAVDHVNASDLDPGLDPLAMNGGFAPDMRSTTFGPTTEAIPPESCVDPFGAPLGVDGRGYARVGSCDIGADQLFGAYAPSPLVGVELLRNGGAAGNELGLAAGDAVGSADPPYWAQPTGGMTQVVYGSPNFPSRSDAPAGSGSYFFAGGANAFTFTSSTQRIDVSSLAAQIDTGEIGFHASGAFGGHGTEDDNAALSVTFDQDPLTPIQTVTIGGFTAADRGNVTKLLPASAAGLLPSGTRLVDVTLTATRLSGAGPYNDGYADDLSLVLPEPAPPAAGALAAITAALLAARRRR